ncbi:membrane protein [Lentzea aerocolonigenes]|uniref:Membrane protein n=1 Tax=Lentzea aerocolonigenes TaxID=68170 RepID=A0A0F0H6Q5_LENAE|nr:membrane protein [Lentzea aerocolonigenes]
MKENEVELLKDDSGMSTVEYAIGTLAVAALAGVLYAIATSDWMENMLQGLIQRALSAV